MSEGEVALALDALRSDGSRPGPGPNRIEHCAVLPDELLPDLLATGAMVVGHPALVEERGDLYRQDYPGEQHAWLHRARSLVDAGLDYAIGSDAPVTDPDPTQWLRAAGGRRTRLGAVLGEREALPPRLALEACTAAPARAVGAEGELGCLRPGALADLVVVDRDPCDPAPGGAAWTVRMTLREGALVAGP